MGLTKVTAAGGVFLRILDGNIVQKSITEKPNWELYKTINPTTNAPLEYWIERYKAIDGYLVKVERVDKPDVKVFGWKLHLLDDHEYLIDIKDSSPTTRRVLAMLPNVQLNERLTIKVFKDKEGYNAIMFQQNGENVPQYWNKENLPEPRKIGSKWNFSDSEALVYDETMKLIPDINANGVDRLDAYHQSVTDAVETGHYTGPQADVISDADEFAPDTSVEPPEEDDLPF